MFADPSLTPENLSTVLDIMEHRLWAAFCRGVNVPESEIEQIRRQYPSNRERKQAAIPHLISTHPSLSWRLVANALYQMGIWAGIGDSSHRALDHLQQLFPTGNTYCINTTVCKICFHPPLVIFPGTLDILNIHV